MSGTGRYPIRTAPARALTPPAFRSVLPYCPLIGRRGVKHYLLPAVWSESFGSLFIPPVDSAWFPPRRRWPKPFQPHHKILHQKANIRRIIALKWPIMSQWATVTVTDKTGRRYSLDVNATSSYDAAHLYLTHVVRHPGCGLPKPTVATTFEIHNRRHDHPRPRRQAESVDRAQKDGLAGIARAAVFSASDARMSVLLFLGALSERRPTLLLRCRDSLP